MIKGRKMAHIGLACADVEANAKWYQEVLGFTVLGRFLGAAHPVYFLKNGETVYELYQVDGMDEAVRGKIDHVAYVSSEIEADYRFCVEAGYEFSTDGIETWPQFFENGCRDFKIKSPCGEEIEFSQVL